MEPDEIIERGRDVQEMETTPGWQAVKQQLEADITEAEVMLKRIDIEGRGPGEIGADYIALARRISGLKRTQEIIESMKEDKAREEANQTS